MGGKLALRHLYPREGLLFRHFGISMGGLGPSFSSSPSPCHHGGLQPPPLILLVIVVGLPSSPLPLGL